MEKKSWECENLKTKHYTCQILEHLFPNASNIPELKEAFKGYTGFDPELTPEELEKEKNKNVQWSKQQRMRKKRRAPPIFGKNPGLEKKDLQLKL
jgi:hypothetical protein